jgi:predicted AAA+ superfamily ATPase
MEYLPRIADKILAEYLDAFGAVLVEGPKWCGKTTTAEQQAASVLKLQSPDTRDGYLATAESHPSLLLDGATPRLIDEWQDAPKLWDAVRTAVDERRAVGQFILTGSNSVDRSKILHSGTGRISRIRMNPMSLWESGESSGEVSLMELFNNPELDINGCKSKLDVKQLIYAACRGGWPASLYGKSERARLLVARSYLQSVCANDISTVDGVERNETLARELLRSYARNVSTLAKKRSIIQDVSLATDGCSEPTFDSYVAALERLFVIQDIDAWSPAVRSASAIRRGKKRGFADPSIAVAALGLSPEQLQMDLKTFGFIFECMAIRDLRAYSQAAYGSIAFYHDRYDLEADAVLHLDDGRYALIEFKLGSNEIDMGASHLLEIRDLMRAKNETEKQIKLREPDLLLVITGGALAYTRPDGVKVVPLACLRD